MKICSRQSGTGLTACIPMLMDTGGNAGNQVSTLIIRGLALGESPPERLSEDSVQRDKSRAHLRTDPRGSQHRQNDALLLRRNASLSRRFGCNGLRGHSGENNRLHPADNRKDDKARPRAHGRTDDNDNSRYGHPAHLLRTRKSVPRDIKNYPPYILVYGGFLCFVWRGLYVI